MSGSGTILDVEIIKLAGKGDGIAECNGKKVFVPFTVIGDVVKVSIIEENKNEIVASLVEIISPSPDRVESLCGHFTKCGGCNLQHINQNSYRKVKQDVLVNIVRRLGFEENLISEIFVVPEKSRRRAEVKISAKKESVKIGFNESRTYNIIDMEECYILDEAIYGLIQKFKKFVLDSNLENFTGLNITKLDEGLDVILTVKKRCNDDLKHQLKNFAQENNIIRLTEKTLYDSSRIYDSGNAYIKIADVKVEVTVGSFLQATIESQEEITRLVLANLEDSRKVADLFCGLGTYTFPALKFAERVLSFEGSEDMVMALLNAAKNHGLKNRVSAQVRDLYKNPLKSVEFKNIDTVIINPPANGAEPQIKEIAKSDVQKVIMVSCNPISFERDARILVASGYKLISTNSVDQFLFTSHLEIVACFVK